MASNVDASSDRVEDELDQIQKEDLARNYPKRPYNHSPTLPFHVLYLTLFNPLNENKKKPTGPVIARKKQGPHGPFTQNPHEIRQRIIERFISRWRKEVGNDIYPAFRLIIPEKDRERPMYGLKENTIAKLLIDVMKINKQSDDGNNLLNWKQPGNSASSKMAGDFAGRCHEVISKRPMLSRPGNMLIDEVNSLLDQLAAASKKEDQLPIFTQFYTRMNADELTWLIRIILRQMKVGATEKTFFNIWHPDADNLFNVSSNLRRICWELYDPNIRLESEERGVTLMQCFQPQLAQFQMRTFKIMVDKMRPTEDDAKFWIEEKLDGERMQLHMITDNEIPGGKRFKFWSRKAKDYTYLYGEGYLDDNSALTRHLREAFHKGVENVILDGEMITWDPEQDAMVPFGTLKTAANLQQANPYSQGWRPFYKVFDILYLNDQVLTNYTLRDRRRALQGAVFDVPRRMEIHPCKEAEEISEIETMLRHVVQESSEGLVLKNPRSAYRLNERNDDWMKVKPEYLTEFGENLDCSIIGGYYGSGHRGGRLSSFLCGLRVDESQVSRGADPMKFLSFFKVGGGFTAADYGAIRHQTEGKWRKWDSKRPPNQYIALAGDHLQFERPDEWILPSDSLVIEVKAASVAATDIFKMGFTLRFPRFKKIRSDRKWDNALSISEFFSLKNKAEQEHKENQLRVDDSRKRRPNHPQKKRISVAGGNIASASGVGDRVSNLFEGLDIFVMTGSQKPEKKTKSEIEALVKHHGARLNQNDNKPDVVCVGDNRTVHVASAIKRGKVDIAKSSWIFDNIKQAEADSSRPALVLPMEPRQMLFIRADNEALFQNNVDSDHDSFARDVSLDELKDICRRQSGENQDLTAPASEFRNKLLDAHSKLQDLPGWIFQDLRIYMDSDSADETHRVSIWEGEHQFCRTTARRIAQFAGALVTDQLQEGVTHVVAGTDYQQNQNLRKAISSFRRLPRIVSIEWVEQSWAEKTRLDEERFALTS